MTHDDATPGMSSDQLVPPVATATMMDAATSGAVAQQPEHAASAADCTTTTPVNIIAGKKGKKSRTVQWDSPSAPNTAVSSIAGSTAACACVCSGYDKDKACFVRGVLMALHAKSCLIAADLL